jgi:hypothetical protein
MSLSNGVYLLSSFASVSNKWSWVVYNDTSSTQEIRARTICATGVDGWEAKWATGGIAAGDAAFMRSECPAGKEAIGGGFKNTASGLNIVTAAIPTAGSPQMWKINVRNSDTLAHTVGVYLACMHT